MDCSLARCCLLVIVSLATGTFADQRPNIVFILADDLGWNDVSFHGSKEIPTPNLDTLAYDGVILNNYYVQPICTPTRGTLLTGRVPIHTGLQHKVIATSQPYGLPLNETVLPEYLKKLGYATHIVGKWHLGMFAKEYTPTYRGFDSHLGYYSGCEDYYDHTYAGKGLRKDVWGLDFWRDRQLLKNDFSVYSTDVFTKEAKRIIETHDTEKPLFLYLPYQAVHSGNAASQTPLEAPWKYILKMSHIKHSGRRLYAAMMSALDDAVGQVTSALHARGLLNNTILVFSTDNGGSANGIWLNWGNNWPLRSMKSTVWEGGSRGVGFIWSPLLPRSGYVSQDLIHVSDWLPTLLHAAGYDVTRLPRNLDGVDAWELLSGTDDVIKSARRTEMLYNIDPIQPTFALRVGDLKVIYGNGSTTQKFRGWYRPISYHDRGLLLPPRDEEYDNAGDGALPREEARAYADVYPRERPSNRPSGVKAAPEYLFRSDLAAILRDLGRKPRPNNPVVVNCGPRPANYSQNCQPEVSPCVFNLTADPCEFNNLAPWRPDMLRSLLTRLGDFNATMVPPGNKPEDPLGFPGLHGGAWVPWRNLTATDLSQLSQRKHDLDSIAIH